MTRLMVLGLLKVKPMSGYEIQQILQTSQADNWAGILVGSIYHALKKMEKEELVAVDTIEQTGHRTKAIYRITNLGETEYQRLLKESLEASSVHLPSTLYTAISFIHDLTNDEAVEALHLQKALLEEELKKQLKGIEIKKAHMKEVDAITELTFINLRKQYELQIHFIEEMLHVY